MNTTTIIGALATLALGTTAFTADYEVQAVGISFAPSQLTVAPGDTITWVSTDTFHTVTSGTGCSYDGGAFNVAINGGDTFEWVVPDGPDMVLDYFCAPHCGFGMDGTINIVNGYCAGDADDSGDVGVTDLLGLLGAWETRNPTYDLTNDQWVDVLDLLFLLGAWGPCAG